MKKVYTLDEVADILKITRRSLYMYIEDGRLPAVKIGRYWRVSEEAIDDFLSRGVKNNAEAVEKRGIKMQ